VENVFVAKDGELAVLILLNGMNVIGQVLGRDETRLSLDKPLAIMISELPSDPRSPGEQKMNIGLQAYMPVQLFPHKALQYRLDHILHEVEPSKALEAIYRQKTSGILMAPAGAEKNLKIQRP
jgi:hypothetical protein